MTSKDLKHGRGSGVGIAKDPPAARNRVRRAWLVSALLTLANPLLHKPISSVCDWARATWGFQRYNRTALIAIPLASLAVVSAALIRQRAFPLRPATATNVVILTALSLAAQRWLLVANIELIHLPQFGLLAVLLLAAGLNAPSAYLVSAAAGALDETYQHFVIYAGVDGTFFDVNDIVLNAVGAAWGVVLFAEIFDVRPEMTADRPPGIDHAPIPDSGAVPARLSWQRGAVVALLALPVAVWLDPPRFNPLLSPTTSGRMMYRVMSTAEGLVVCTLLWGMTHLLLRRGIPRDTVRTALT